MEMQRSEAQLASFQPGGSRDPNAAARIVDVFAAVMSRKRVINATMHDLMDHVRREVEASTAEFREDYET